MAIVVNCITLYSRFLLVEWLSVYLWQYRYTNCWEDFQVLICLSFNCRILKSGHREIQISICCNWHVPCKYSCSHIQWVANWHTEDTRGWEDSLGLGLSICDLADEDGIFWVADVSLLVHVGGGNGKHGAIIIEGKWGNAGRVPVELTQALFVEWVPDVHKAIWATWKEEKLKVKLKRLKPCYSWDTAL